MVLQAKQLGPTIDRIDRGRAFKQALLMKPGADWTVPYAQPLLDAVALFEELKIGYALAGGIAAMFYGRARFTEDVDFVAVSGHMDTFAAHPDVMEHHHFDSACTYKLYHQSGVQVDLWKDEFANDIVSRATDAQLAGCTVKIVDIHDLVAMKLRAGRIKDDYDVSEILHNNTIDEARLRASVTLAQFQHFMKIRERK